MSYSTKEEENSSFKPMPREQLLGFDENGNVFIEKWQKNLSLHFSGIYGKMAECLSDLEPRPYHDAKAVFEYKDENGVTKKIPTEAEDFIAHHTVKNAMRNFGIDQSNWSNAAPKMCSHIIRGALVKPSQDRLLSLREAEVSALRKKHDVLGLVDVIINVHLYTGDVFDDKAIRAAKAEWSSFGQTLMQRNTTLQQHKDNYNRIRQKLKTFKLLENENMYTKKDLMDAFICPLIDHPNHLIVQRVNQILCGKIIPYPDDIEKEFQEMAKIINNSTLYGLVGKAEKSNASVNVNNNNNSSKVNSAHGSAHKSLKEKIERNRSEETNKKVGISYNNPQTTAFVDKRVGKNASKEKRMEILNTITCNNCGGLRHLAADCRKIKNPDLKKSDAAHPKKKFGRGKKGKVHFTSGNNSESGESCDSEDEDEEDNDIDGMMGYVKMMYGEYDDVPDLVSDSDSESEWDETPYIPQQYVDDSFPVLSHPLAERAIREELEKIRQDYELEEQESGDSDTYADMPELVSDSDSEFDDMPDLIDGAALFPIAEASTECATVDQSFEEQASSSDSSTAEDHGDEDNFECTMLVGGDLVRCRCMWIFFQSKFSTSLLASLTGG